MIQTLNLDKDFTPFKNGGVHITFKTLDFYSGIEPHIKLDPKSFDYCDETVSLITCRPKNGNDLLRVFLATDAIRQLKKEAKIWLFLPFVPFARQDRVCEPGEPLSVKVFADMLNNQKYDRVFVYDPHSDVAPALINNCCVIKNHQFVREVRAEILGNAKSYSDLLFISPDAGSYKKIFNTVKELHHTGKIVICEVWRNQ